MTSPSPSPYPASGPFYFAWVNQGDTTFDENTMLVEDEDIFDFTIQHDEGQFATLNMTIRNPRIGLLNAGRKLWAWFAYRDISGHIHPLFFGVLVSVPQDMFAELVQLKFNARPHEFIPRKQEVAETLKIRPYYDPVFLDDAHRDDPDAILEGWSKLYHIDRITHAITVSDILEGEDGTVTFDQTQGFYDSVKCELGECPLDTVQVQADVTWTQRCTGIVPQKIGVNVSSYTGGSFKGDWPKPGTQLGGGWKCEASYVTDVLGTEHAKSTSNSSSYQNTDKNAGDCSTESASSSSTTCNVPGITVDDHVEFETGLCDPLGFNPDGSQGVNWPAKVNGNGTLALLWVLNCVMYVRYDAKREFTEELKINVQANLQNTVTSPSIEQSTEVIKVSGANVGMPLLNISAWSNFRSQHVDEGQMIRPNDRAAVGGEAYQICTQAGIAGAIEPTFSDTPGDITVDGSVHWASLGENVPSNQPAWTDSTPVPIGEIVLYEPRIWSDAAGAFEPTGESCFLLCITPGTTASDWVDFTYKPTATSNDDDPNPLPILTAYIPGPGQFSPYAAPTFAQGARISDGDVLWLSLGESPSILSIPIGGTTESVTARSYFTQGRGLWSVEHLICKARARLRLRSRCVKVQWDAPFEDCLGLSLRKNATILDGRIPGGAATGKITSYNLQATSDGKLMGHVEIGVAVGFGNSVPDVTGTPEYTAATGYMQPGYQLYDGGAFSIADEEINYTRPAFRPFDDGLAFPLQFFPGVVKMTVPNQVEAVEKALAEQGSSFIGVLEVPALRLPPAITPGPKTGPAQVTLLGEQSVGQFLQDVNPREYALESAPIACEIIIHPVTNGPFNGTIAVKCSTLEIPMGINLAADSS